MRYEVFTVICYSLHSRHDAWFRLTYEVNELRPGVERWFLVAMEELHEATKPEKPHLRAA